VTSFLPIFRYLFSFRNYLGRRLYILFVLTALVALAEGFGIALLLPLFHAIDAGGLGADGLDGKLPRLLHDVVAFVGLTDSVLGIIFFIGFVFVIKGLLKFGEAAYRSFLHTRLLRELKSRLFNEYSGMSYQYYVKRSTGHFLNMINNQTDGLYGAFRGFMDFWVHIVTAFIYIGAATLLAWRFALIALVVGVVLLFLFSYINRYVRRLSHQVAREMGVLNNLLVQALQGFKYVVSTGQTPRFRRDVTHSIHRFTRYQFRQMLAAGFTRCVKEPLGIVLVLGIVVFQVGLMEAPLAPILVSLLLFYRSVSHIIGIQGGWQSTMDKIASLELIEDELGEAKRWQETNGKTVLKPLSKGIEFKNVEFGYEEEALPVLRNVSLRIPTNATVAFVGESGAGKSTLIDMLTLLLRPTSGEVLIDGVLGQNVEVGSWRSQIGYVSQDIVVFDDTIANNICLWNGDYQNDPETRRKVESAAKAAFADGFINELPAGYQTPAGDRGVRLSGGQRQRLFIARELYKKPRLLILDEATSALDTESERYIQESVQRMKGKTTVVLVAHRLSTIKDADSIYVIDKGRIVEQGSYSDLVEKGRRFQRMVEIQQL
jgi:ABC-type multidrug transport system fused ATPase/permease subunit